MLGRLRDAVGRDRPRACSTALLLATLSVLALAPRVYKLGSLPPIHVDEAIAANSALDLLHDPAGWLEPSSTHYLAASQLPLSLVFAVTGPSLEASRALAVAYGVGAVLAAYWAGRAFFGPTAGTIAAVVLATSHLAIAMSRLGAVNGQAILLGVACFALFGQALRGGDRWWLLLGACAGLGLYSYEGFRIVPLAIALGLLTAPALLWSRRRQVSLAAVAFMAVATPLLIAFALAPGDYIRETSRLSVFGGTQGFLDAYDTDSVFVVVREQLERSFDYFMHGGSRDTHYMYRGAGFDSLTRALFFAGVIAAAVRIRDTGYRTLLLWFGLGLLASALTESPPLAPRLALLLPAAALLCGAALGQALDRLPAWRRPVTVAVTLAAGAVLAVSNLGIYFDKYSPADDVFWPWIEPNRSIGLYLSDLEEQEPVYLFRTPGVWADNPILDFLRRSRGTEPRVVDIGNWRDASFNLERELRALPRGRLTFVVTREGTQVMRHLRALCPQGELTPAFGRQDAGNRTSLLFEALRISDGACLTQSLDEIEAVR
jgi:4-amino-4-deoxy-L-arabinose transferase-like glycosyltransferase